MGIMLVYDITNEKSFENIKNWIRNIEEHAGKWHAVFIFNGILLHESNCVFNCG